MSFTQAAVRRVATQVPRTFITTAPRAAFSSSVVLQKSAVDSAKDTLKTVDRAVADKLVDGINVGGKSTHFPTLLYSLLTDIFPHTENVVNKVKGTAEEAASKTANTSAAELRGEAKGTANEMAGKAKGTANEYTGKAKGAASEYSGEAKGTAEQLKGKAKGVAHDIAGKAKGAADRAEQQL